SHTNVLDVIAAFPALLTLKQLCEIQGATYRRVYTIAGIERDEKGAPQSITFYISTCPGYIVPAESFGTGKKYEGLGAGYIKQVHAQKQENHPEKAEIFVQRRSFGPPEKNRGIYPGSTAVPD